MAFLPLLGVAAGAGGALLGGISAGQSAHFQAEVARQNAKIEQQNAQRAAMATSSQVTQAGLKARAQDANVRASAAANGIDVNSGSPVDVQTSQRELGNLDVANTAQRGAAQTYGYETQATGDLAQASLDQSKVVPDILGGALGAAGTAASGASLLSGPPGGAGGPSALSSDFAWMQSNNTLQPGETGQLSNGNILDF